MQVYRALSRYTWLHNHRRRSWRFPCGIHTITSPNLRASIKFDRNALREICDCAQQTVNKYLCLLNHLVGVCMCGFDMLRTILSTTHARSASQMRQTQRGDVASHIALYTRLCVLFARNQTHKQIHIHSIRHTELTQLRARRAGSPV